MKTLLTLLLLGNILMATTLDYLDVNGVKIPLIYEKDNRLPLASAQIVFRNSGSIMDNNQSGLAKLSAKMMNEGTLKRGSTGFASALDAKAIHLSVSTGSETLVMEVGALSEHFSEGFGFLNELLVEPNLSDESLKKVKTQVLGSIKRKENDFDYTANVQLKALLYEGTSLANPSVGTEKSISALELKDVKTFLKEHLVLNRAIIVLGGDIDLDKVKKELTTTLSQLPKGEEGTLPTFEIRSKPTEITLKRETEQAYLYFGAPYNIKVGDTEEYKGRVATFILGAGGFGSRLMEEIRVKRGLAYSAYARPNVARSHSFFFGYLQTKLESLDEARTTTNEVMKTFVEKGVTQEELDHAKKFLLGSEPLRVETLSQRLSRTFMEYYKGEELGSSKEDLAKIESLTLAEVNAFIKEHKEILDLTYSIVTK